MLANILASSQRSDSLGEMFKRQIEWNINDLLVRSRIGVALEKLHIGNSGIG